MGGILLVPSTLEEIRNRRPSRQAEDIGSLSKNMFIKETYLESHALGNGERRWGGGVETG